MYLNDEEITILYLILTTSGYKYLDVEKEKMIKKLKENIYGEHYLQSNLKEVSKEGK